MAQPNRAQEKAKTYMEEHRIERTISEMLNSLVHSHDSQPVIYMIKYLANRVPHEELRSAGIEIEGPLPQRVPLLHFPEFDPACSSLLKKHLTHEIWTNLKKRATKAGGKIQFIV